MLRKWLDKYLFHEKNVCVDARTHLHNLGTLALVRIKHFNSKLFVNTELYFQSVMGNFELVLNTGGVKSVTIEITLTKLMNQSITSGANRLDSK